MVKKDYYEILGVSRDANASTIKKAYRRLAMQYHPDRNPSKEKWANEKFKEINEAFGVLGDPEKKKQYDKFGTVGNIGDIFGSPFTRTTFEDLMKDFRGSGLGFGFLKDIFGDILGGRGFGKVRFEFPGGMNLGQIFGQAEYPPRQEIRYEITLTKEQAAKGLEKDLKRRGKTLRLKIPAGVKTGAKIRLRNARQVTDGQPGDIIILVKIK